MVAKKVIVKRLASIHNLGSMDAFCTDKTGTLTEARIHLERHIDPLGRESRRVPMGSSSVTTTHLTEHMVQGVDVWLNTPRRPWEACGTSGMKVLVNGGINLSELDGWWVEA